MRLVVMRWYEAGPAGAEALGEVGVALAPAIVGFLGDGVRGGHEGG